MVIKFNTNRMNKMFTVGTICYILLLNKINYMCIDNIRNIERRGYKWEK